jgi:hypothetical protein
MSGAAAANLCHLAAGVVDSYWQFNLKPWDGGVARPGVALLSMRSARPVWRLALLCRALAARGRRLAARSARGARAGKRGRQTRGNGERQGLGRLKS